MSASVRAFGTMEIIGGVRDAPETRRLTSRPRRVLLGLLLAHRGGVVSSDRLVEAMWPVVRPVAPGKSLQVQVHRLRRSLEAVATVRFRPPGYSLSIPDEQVDLHQFERLLGQARQVRRAGALTDASARYRQALALYRGPAFHGLDDVEDLAFEARRLAELRVGALVDWMEVELALGRHADLVAELHTLVAGHPLRERFRAQLMTALHRCGRAGEALAVYQAGEELTRRELGVGLGEECRALAQAILTGQPPPDPADGTAPAGSASTVGTALPAGSPPAAPGRGRDTPVPRQLPPDVRGFTGRSGALRRLDATLDQLDGPAPVVVTVDGMGGVGKTALAVHWGHRVADRFPDGQLFLDLHGFAATRPRTPREALIRLLMALEADGEEIPSGVDDAAARLRSRLAGRRVLLILDDAASAEQVRPLLPGTGGCLVVVTSRRRLTGLVAREGAHRLPLEPLPDTESVALLTSLVGPARVGAEPAAVAEIARLCGHLPLPLRVVAAGLAGTPGQRVRDWVVRLRAGDRLRQLAVPDDRRASVDAVFGLSYQRLPVDARRTFRLLGLVPVRSVSVTAAAALAELSVEKTRNLLETLVEARLLDRHVGRYTWHELVRAYAEQRARDEEHPAGRDRARARFYGFYCGTAEAVAGLFYPPGQHPPSPGGASSEPTGGIRFASPAEGMAWVEAELSTIRSIVLHTATEGPYQVAWRLADAVRGFLHHGVHLADAWQVHQAAVSAAGKLGDQAAQGAALVNLAGIRFQQGRYRQAQAYGLRALRLLRGRGWDVREAMACNLLGMTSSEQGRLDEAARYFLTALARYERIGWRYGQAQAVGNLAVTVFELGRLREAADYAGRAAAVFAELGSAVNEAHTLNNLGRTCYHLGRLDEAARHLTRACERYREVGDDADQADPIAGLALVDSATGQLLRARRAAEAALAIVDRAGNTRNGPGCWLVLATVHQRSGAPDRARSCFEQALAAARSTGERYAQAAALIGLAGICPSSTAARAHLTEALELVRRVGYRLLEGQALTILAELDLADGAVATAVAGGESALAVHRATGYRIGEVHAHRVLHRALLVSGRPEAAEEHRQLAETLSAGFTEQGRSPEPAIDYQI